MKTPASHIVMGLLLGLCSCGQLPDDDTGDVPLPQRPADNGDLATLLGDAAAWQMVSSAILVGGFDDQVEFVSVVPEQDAPCLDIDTQDAWLALLDDSVIFGAIIDDRNGSRSCTIDLSADAAPCLNDDIFCTVSDPDGLARVEDERFDLTSVDLIRIPQCPTAPTTLETLDDWAIFNTYPLALSLVVDPATVDGGVVVTGNAGLADNVSIAVGQQNGSFVGCLGSTEPTGTIALTANGLSVDLQAVGDDGSRCTLTFTGSQIYCAEASPADVGESGAARHTIRFEGSGQWTRDGAQSGELAVLYLGYEVPSLLN